MKIYFPDDPVKQKMLDALIIIFKDDYSGGFEEFSNSEKENMLKLAIESAIGKSIEEVIND